MSKRAILLSSAALLMVTLVWEKLPRVWAAGEVDVVVNKTNSITDLSLADAKKIFLCDKTTWPSGKRISVVMLAAGQPERAAVLSEIFKMNEGDYGKYMLQASFSGKIAAPPKELGSAALVKQYIAGNPGAIGYLKHEDADDSVKVVLKLQ